MSSPGQRQARHLPPATPSPRRGHLTPPGHGRLPPPRASPQPLPPALQPAVSVSRRPQYQETLFMATLLAAYHRTGPCVKMCLLTQVCFRTPARPRVRIPSLSARGIPPVPPAPAAPDRHPAPLRDDLMHFRCTDRYVSESATTPCHSDARGSTPFAFRAPAPLPLAASTGDPLFARRRRPQLFSQVAKSMDLSGKCSVSIGRTVIRIQGRRTVISFINSTQGPKAGDWQMAR